MTEWKILGLGRVLKLWEVADMLGIKEEQVEKLPGLHIIQFTETEKGVAETWLLDWMATTVKDLPPDPS